MSVLREYSHFQPLEFKLWSKKNTIVDPTDIWGEKSFTIHNKVYFETRWFFIIIDSNIIYFSPLHLYYVIKQDEF